MDVGSCNYIVIICYNSFKVMKKTPGPFSHKKNPIHLVRNGRKIAEATGGEYILNPTQMAKIKGYAAKNSKDKLHSYICSIIKKFEKP